ncbi:hypothetical protein MNBD_IGNAVI01-2194 [hydrothermal vent metagenome]|uniref:Outer membrane protein beta-barrel domain-containing protein n=1 Tax=hydrothermal vent metagenome TaxID=652676 RepID=A0A3B1CIC2_9ZZZZ
MKNYIIIFCLMIFTGSVYGQADYGFTLKGGVNFPVGDFVKYYNAGLGGFGGLFYNINSTTRISLTIGYNSWALDLDALNKDLNNSGNPGKYDIEAPISTIPILINVKFFWRKNKKFHPYAVLEGGVYKTSKQVYGKFIPQDGESLQVTPRDVSTTDGSFNFGVGFEYPLNETLTLDVSSRYHLVLNQDVYNLGDAGYGTTYSTNNFISIFAGINVFFQ